MSQMSQMSQTDGSRQREWPAPGARPPVQDAAAIERAARVYRLALHACPSPMRAAHGGEMAQVFRCLSRDAWAARGALGVAMTLFAALGDLLSGVVEEYAALLLGTLYRGWSMYRLRSSAILVFCAYIVFIVSGMGFQKLTEEVVKSSVPATHPTVALAYDVVAGGAVLALLATLAGGLPIALATAREALAARRWGILALFAVPPVMLALWLGWTFIILNTLASARPAATPAPGWVLLSWVGLFGVAAVVSVLAVALAISRVSLRPALYRFALGPEVVLALGMVVTLLAAGGWTAQVWAVAPSYLTARSGGLGFGYSVIANLIAQMAIMLIATIIVVAGIARGYEARRAVA